MRDGMAGGLLAAVLTLLACLPVPGQVSYQGDTRGGPRFRRPTGGNPPIALAPTGGTNGNNVPYHVYTFVPAETRQYRIVSTTQAPLWDNFIVLYRGEFQPASPLTNVMAANDDFGNTTRAGIDAVPLTAGQTYTIVVTGFSNTSQGAFETTITPLPPTVATTGNPVFNRPIPNGDRPPVQLSTVATAVPFGVMEFTPAETGIYRLTSRSLTPGFNNFTVLYQDRFLPGSPLTSVLIANENLTDETLSGFEVTLTGGRTYFFVTTGSTMDDYGAYVATVERVYRHTMNGTTAGAPVYHRTAEGAPPTALDTQATAVPYTIYRITPETNAIAHFLVTSLTPGYDPFTALYHTSFAPDRPLENVLLANDDRGSAERSGFEDVPLMAGTDYFLVVSGYNNADFGDFQLTVSLTRPAEVTPYRFLTGTVTRAERPREPFEVTLTFRPADASGDITRTVPVDAEGRFTVRDLRATTYRVRARAAHTLSRVVEVDLSRGARQITLGALPGGDANDDNAVDVLDLDALIRAFDAERGQEHYDPGADFNGDGSVDVLDLDTLLRNFDQAGAEFD
ncbi:MAG: dockerin type I domain-containing protein [Chloroherpetonaceae bacterium]|nr:dockerin type I domain-containing protein [Chthonomonadaceae bacterium]MDW8207747.1 dockerin type I domain-containing protein [Chloroherpetonaceae bacterium]